MEKEDDRTAAFCPSFSSYTCDQIAETAERVRVEYSDEFEFVNHEALSSSSDCDFVFPIFNQILIPKTLAGKSDGDKDESSLVKVATPLRDLFLRDREFSPPIQAYSSSSEEEEEEEGELNGISSEMYCRWKPEKSPNGGWRKSKSTGSSSSSSSRRWRIKDLLKRSYSEGKQSLKLLNLNATNREESSRKKEKVSAHEKFYLRNKAMKEEEKRKSYLPYRQDLFGFFSNPSRYGKTLPPL